MINFKWLFHHHRWEIIQDGNYDYLGIPSPPTIRKCTKCGIHQELIVECLGLNPPEYYRFWIKINENPPCFNSNPSFQEQAENDCNTCKYIKDCLK